MGSLVSLLSGRIAWLALEKHAEDGYCLNIASSVA